MWDWGETAQASSTSSASGTDGQTDSWTSLVIGDAKLPIRLLTVQQQHPDIHIETMTLTPASPPTASAEDKRQQLSAPQGYAAVTPSVTAPSSPVFLLRQAMARGKPISVIAFSPFVVDHGIWSRVTVLRATLSGVVTAPGQPSATDLMIADSVLPSHDNPGHTPDSTPAQATPATSATPVAPPLNPVQADQPMWRIVVSETGIQRLTGSALTAAGINLGAIQVNRLRVQHAGIDLALQIINAGASGRLDMASELRFFARAPGDRWNQTDTYWLSVGQAATVSMTTRPAVTHSTPSAGGSDAAPTRSTATVEGDWHRKHVYDSLTPGPDHDHWFAAKLDETTHSVTATLDSELPFSTGTMFVTATGSVRPAASGAAASASGLKSLALEPLRITLVTYSPAASQTQTAVPMPVKAASVPIATAAQAGTLKTTNSDWTTQFDIATYANATSLTVQVSAAGVISTNLNDIRWQAPAALAFNGAGAFFVGVDGTWTYRLSGVPAGAMLYDVADWQHPAVIPMQATAETGVTEFIDGPTARHYVLAASGTQFEPLVSMRTTADVVQPINARGVYIAPASLHAALQPLLAHRLSTGWLVTLIDTQAIYDTWSYGQVSPDAIRNFLRYAMASWSIKPSAVILVGAGNYDPLNYSGSAPPTLVPPYLADVDPWLGEAACESCYAQLDGDDPLSDALPDLYFGRLPAKNAAEVTAIVNKIIGYETAAPGTWNWRNVFASDNFQEADGTPDDAGNFAFFNDESIAQQPLGVAVERAYFDPYPATASLPGHSSSSANVHQHLLDLWNSGAAVVNFSGHGQTDRWAYLDANVPNLLTTADAAGLSNGIKLPFVLSMACLTGAFDLPSAGSSSIDAQLVLTPNGGAIGTWSSTGLGVMFSHEFLRNGFYHALWSGTPGSLTMGALTRASLLNLYEQATCCQDPLRTYVLLGDPLTPVRVALPPQHVFMPVVTH